MHKIILLLISCSIYYFVAAGRLGLERRLWWLQNARQQQETPITMAPQMNTALTKQFKDKQLFFLDILLQVHKPLLNQKLIELGKVLIMDPAMYSEPTDEFLLEFLEKCRQHEILGRYQLYSYLNVDHARQLIGLTKFLTLAKDWATFQRNVCFARLHMNPVIFVNALQRAIRERSDTTEIVLPAINEILPQLFYDKNIIIAAENVGWHELLPGSTSSVKPTLVNILNPIRVIKMISPINWMHIGQTRRWQIGNMGPQVPVPMNMAQNEANVNDPNYVLLEAETKLVIPVEERSPLSYLTDDVGLNIFWNEAMFERLKQTLTREQMAQAGAERERNTVSEEQIEVLSKRNVDDSGNIVNQQSRSAQFEGLRNDIPEYEIQQQFPKQKVSTAEKKRLLRVGRRRQSMPFIGNEPTEMEHESKRESAWSVDVDRQESRKVGEDDKTPKDDTLKEGYWKTLVAEKAAEVEEVEEPNRLRMEPKRQSTWVNIVDGDRLMSRQSNDYERERLPRSTTLSNILATENIMNSRSGEIFIQNLRQLMARINLEKLSLGLDATENVDEISATQLLTTNGVQYQKRALPQEAARQKITQTLQKLQSVIDRTLQNKGIELSNLLVLPLIGDILIQRNGERANIWDELYAEINNFIYGQASNEGATLLSIPSGNLREPIYLDIVEGLNKLIDSYVVNLQPYTPSQLTAPGIVVQSLDVDQLVTYFDVTDADLINLVDQQLLQSATNNIQRLERQLVARQRRLNHKEFTLNYGIISERNQRVVVRTFLGPKMSVSQLDENRQNFMLLDAFVKNLDPGLNQIARNSRDITWTTRDTTTLSEIYRTVMRALPTQNLVGPNCRFPQRLLIPRGSIGGVPMQLFVIVTPVTDEDRLLQQLVDPSRICGLGVAGMSLDALPLNFPFDRKIDDPMVFLQDNMKLSDVLVVHKESNEVGDV